MSKPVVDSSIRSWHTGHVGNSTRAGVGGANGFVVVRVVADEDDSIAEESTLAGVGLNGSLVMFGKLIWGGEASREVSKVTDWTKTT